MGLLEITNIFGMMLLTSTTGTMFLIIWWFFQKWIAKGKFVKLTYQMLIVCVISFAIPLLHIIIWISQIIESSIEGTFLLKTPKILQFLQVVRVIWMIGFVIMLIYYGIGLFRLYQIKKHALFVDKEYITLLERCKVQIGLKKQVKLLQSTKVQTPIIMGIWNPIICVPAERAYTESEWEIFLMHELVHCKHNDVILKYTTILIHCVYWFHPFAWLLYRWMNQWSEIRCDDTIKDIVGDTQQYCRLLLKIATEHKDAGEKIAVPFFERKTNLERRIVYMKENKTRRVKGWRQTGIIMAAFLLVSSSGAWAAGEAIQDGYNKVYDRTMVAIEEEPQSLPQYEEHVAHIDDYADFEIIDEEDTDISTFDMNNIIWPIGAGQLRRSGAFSVTKGDTIRLAIEIEPAGNVVHLGIIEPDGEMRYVIGATSMYHQFKVNKSGTHRVFVVNTSSSTITVRGYYNY